MIFLVASSKEGTMLYFVTCELNFLKN